MSYVQPQNSGRRFTGFIIVVALHALLVYGLIHGLAGKIVHVISEPLEIRIIAEVKPLPDKPLPDKPPPSPPAKLAPPPPYIPPSEVQAPEALRQNAITIVTSDYPPPVPVSLPLQPHVPDRTAAIVNASACEKPEYPPAARRAQEEGLVTLAFLIDVDGKVLESKVERSSGSRRLDDAAQKALGLCKFQAAQVDGKPEKSWARIGYQWRIE